MSETALNFITTIVFLCLGSYAIHLRHKAPHKARSGLKRVSSGFLLASVVSLAWIVPLDAGIPNVLSGAMVALGLLIALNGLSLWRNAMLRLNASGATLPSDDSDSVETAPDLVKFVDSCLGWANLNRETISPKALAQSFLELLEREIGVGVSLMTLNSPRGKNGDITQANSASSVIACRGFGENSIDDLVDRISSAFAQLSDKDEPQSRFLIVSGKRFVVTKQIVGPGKDQTITLACENGSVSSSATKTLETALSLFCSALERQAVSRKVIQAEESANLKELVTKSLERVLCSTSGEDSGSMELRTTRIVFETLDEALNRLDSNLAPITLRRDFMLVETSKSSSKMTVALSKSESNGKVSIGFFPYSRRVCFSDTLNSKNALREVETSLIEKLPVYDSRIGRKRIVSEGLRSVIHGTLEACPTDNSAMKVVVVIGIRNAKGFEESQRKIMAQVLREMQDLLGFVETPQVTSTRGENFSPLGVSSEMDMYFANPQLIRRGGKPRAHNTPRSEESELKTPTLTI